MDSNDPDVVRLQGTVLALTIAVHELMQHLYETDPEASSQLRRRITNAIKREPVSDQLKAVANDLNTRFLFTNY